MNNKPLNKHVYWIFFKDSPTHLPHMGFGGALGAPPLGLNLGGGVRSFLASQERFLTTLLWMAQLTQ